LIAQLPCPMIAPSTCGLSAPGDARAGKPPRPQFGPLEVRQVPESALGTLEPFAEGASAIIFRAIVPNAEV